MWKKLVILSLSVAVLLFLAAPIAPVNAGGKWKRINWRVAGSIVNTVSVKTFGTPSDQTLILLKAKGAPGPADLTILGIAGDLDFTGTNGCDVYIPFLQDEFVAVFNDLSLLFAKLSDDEEAQSYLCKIGDETTFLFDMKIFGGTGRFVGAKGEFTATGVGHGEGFEGPLSAESGEFTGVIEFNN